MIPWALLGVALIAELVTLHAGLALAIGVFWTALSIFVLWWIGQS